MSLLLDEGTAVWRPVMGERVVGDRFRLAGPVPDGERWVNSSPAKVVRCVVRAFSNGEPVLAAVARADAEPSAAPDPAG